MSSKKQNISMDDLINENPIDVITLKRGDVLEGKIISLSKNEALIDLGVKAEGVLPFAEANDVSALQVGKNVSVYVIAQEDRYGQLLLSESRAQIVSAWSKLQEADDKSMTLEAVIAGFNKGGCVIRIEGLQGFLPFSLFMSSPDVKLSPPEFQSALDKMRGTKINVQVIELDLSQNKIIVSEKAAIIEERKQQIDNILQSLKFAQIIDVVIKQVLPFGLLAEYHAVAALIPIEELTWEENAQEQLSVYEVGQKVKAKIIGFPKKNTTGRLKLSIKQLSQDPWLKLVSQYKRGKRITGKVTKITSFGLLVNLEEGLEGLVPLSEFTSANKEVHVGDELSLRVKAVDKDNKRLELGIGDE